MIIVTAGHVDHGKTSLLKALTGTNTAHLPEEKRRGLTIDLGYAYLPLADSVLGFIDVPGHQKFLSNMLAGLGGVDYALLVVSAEEGIKPQTEEHLTILNLLQFKQIIVAITKSDRVEIDQIHQRCDQLRGRFPVLSSSPFFVTSAQAGDGIEELKTYLTHLSQNSSLQSKPFRYAIDRVFTIKGAGVVVTGTAIAGEVQTDEILYLSNGKKVRVKAIYAQNQPSELGKAGQRLALNLTNVEKEEIQRGDWITALSTQTTDRIAVKLTAVQPLKESNVVHLYHYARHVTGKLTLLNTKQAVTSGHYFAEVVFDEPLLCVVDDKLIVRNGDDSQTLAGVTILDIHPPKRHKRSESRLAYLADLDRTENSEQRFALYLARNAIELDKIMWAEQLFEADITQIVIKKGYFSQANYLFDVAYKNQVQQKLVDALHEYHQQHGDQLGVTKARLHRMAALTQPVSLVYTLIEELLEHNILMQTRGWLHTPDHQIAFSAEEEQYWAEIHPLFEATNQALWVRDIAQTLAVDETAIRNLLYKAGKLGYLVPIVKDRFLLQEQVYNFARLIKQFISQYGEISVNQLRDEIQYGRKLTVQLIEYFDRVGFLRRKGNVHLLRDSDAYCDKAQ